MSSHPATESSPLLAPSVSPTEPPVSDSIPAPTTRASNVIAYDVSIVDPQNSTPIIFYDDDPITMIYKDFWILLKNWRTLPLVLYPAPKPGRDITNKGAGLQALLVVVSIILTALCLLSFFIGMPPPVISVSILCAWIYGFNAYAGKERVTYQDVVGDDKDEKEAWLFVNGIGTSRSGLKLILDDFYRLFGRRVTGVHNRTFGVWFDLVECTLQRDLTWNTTDTREGYNIIAKHVADGTKEKIVLIAHSQGGIIMSSWADQLLADFSYQQLKKVEIYTFASAANHFSIPETEHGPAFGCVEHFVNEKDYVSDIGLLAFTPQPPRGLEPNASNVPRLSGRFAGRIFKRLNQTGHLLLTHYLAPGNSILDDPAVIAHSKFASYLLSPEEKEARDQGQQHGEAQAQIPTKSGSRQDYRANDQTQVPLRAEGPSIASTK
ncbi:uncharacterized protein IL334_003735 [Kwoniella shivajii]|uniref:DUF676 domain-containing protein n=1 Tax=Kwoniella shivajii TaxID=564305 RepID=A0ABZ1CYE5_9TREE|nr:hypothetical protein IL334_003735 [Kwoniella shivajii]